MLPLRLRHCLLRLPLLLLALTLLPAPVLALAETSVRPFVARYDLEVRGWPDATIDHRLSREGHHWLSEMRTAIAIGHGEERSRFTVDGDGVHPLHYASGYSLLGVGDRYRLAPDDLIERPDRQSALFELSQRAATGACTADCQLHYLDHRGEDETLVYRLLSRETLRLPAGEFEAIKLEVTDPDEPDRRLIFGFHPAIPGLLLSVEYHRDGKRRSRLKLTELTLP